MCACVPGVTACEVIQKTAFASGCWAHTQPVTGSTGNANADLAAKRKCFIHNNPDDGVCVGTHASLTGDPWCQSFDGLGWACHGQGDLILATSRAEDDPLMIQARSRVGEWGTSWTLSKDAGFVVSENVPAVVASVPNWPDADNKCT